MVMQLLRVNYLFFILLFTLLWLGCLPSNVEQKGEEPFPFLEMSIDQIQLGYSSGDFTIQEVVSAYLDRIEAIDENGPSLGSILTLNPEAMDIAAQLDKERQEGKIRGPLHGIPVILKDNIDTHDKMPTTGGSRALKNSYPLKDSYVAQRLRQGGAILIAKANLSEWANFRGELSTSGWSGLGGQTKNPYVLDRNPCGSSSGSAVAVSANLSPLAIGTETNGSIVCPSHNNGIVGIKPTVGLWSRSGIIPISSTQDTPGPMAKSVRDAAICLGVVVGVDSSDTKTLASKGNFLEDYTPHLIKEGLQGKRIGIFTGPLGRHFKVDSLFKLAIEDIKKAGAEVIEIDRILPSGVGANSFEIMLYEYKEGLNAYFTSLGEKAPLKSIEDLIAFNQKDSLELRYFNQAYLETAAAKEGLDSEGYKKALASMLEGSRDLGMDRVMNQYELDAIVAPTGAPAWKTDLVNGDSYTMGSSSPAAQSGYPSICVPMGFIDELPVGISFFGRAWSEPLLIEVAYSYEQATQHRKMPKFLTH